MKNLIVIGHPDKKSFCYSGIFKTVQDELENANEEIRLLICTGIVLLDPETEL